MEGTTQWKGRTLYYRGDPRLLGRRSAAVVGTRHPQEKGRAGGYRMTEKMCGITDLVIVTGLAIGCDTIAARAALDSGTPVIAVLPSGTSNICPRSNRALAEEIVEKGGCLVSEYPPDAHAEKWKFIARDMLMAEIADAVIAIECGENSGTMHTVRAAHGLGKKLGCLLPSDTASGGFEGNLLMVSEYGAEGIRNIRELKRFLDTL